MAKPTLTESDVHLEINARDYIGDLADDDTIREAFAQDIIDFIVDRTRGMRNVYGNPLKSPYSDSYSESEIFKAFGKNKNQVNMTLTGGMLDSIDVIEDNGETFKIGFNDESEIPKAYNHNVGETVPKRFFFGIMEKDLIELAKRYEQSTEDEEFSEFFTEEEIEEAIKAVEKEISVEVDDG